jgi:hypothetical protein
MRKFLSLVVCAIALLGLGATTANATTPSGASDDTKASRPAPRAVTVSGSEPTMWPPAERVEWHLGGVRDVACDYGVLCVDAWDPTRSRYKVFFLRKCVTHALHHFTSTGTPEMVNDQTAGTVTRFLRQNGSLYSKSVAFDGRHRIDWDPIWYIDVC